MKRTEFVAFVATLSVAGTLPAWEVSRASAAAADDAGESVTIPGASIPGWGEVDSVPGRFTLPHAAPAKVPAVLILHGAFGEDARGSAIAGELQKAGIATLQITMFEQGQRPREGRKATMPHAAAALRWLGAQPRVNAARLGVMGFSWGGGMSVLLASGLVQDRLGKDVPKPVAFAAFYPTCTDLVAQQKNPLHAFYQANAQMSGAPVLIYVGTRDDYEVGERPCDALVAMWPEPARDNATIRYIEGGTHDFDALESRTFHDSASHGGRGGSVSIVPNPEAAAAARQGVVQFFVTNLRP